jgi:hypothetical protein
MCKRVQIVLIVLTLSGSFILGACEKEKTFSEEGTEPKEGLDQKSNGDQKGELQEKAEDPGGPGELCACSGYELSKDNGTYGCPSGDGGCTKITPCPCPTVAGNPVANGKEAERTLMALDDAVEQDRVAEFFSSGPWKKLFPFLEDDEEKLRKLRNGSLTMLRLGDPDDAPLHYAAVAASADEISDPEEAVFSVQFPGTMQGVE